MNELSVLGLGDIEDARARRLKAIEAFAVHGMTIKEAAAFTGIKPATLSAMKKDPRVQGYIKNLQEANAKKLNVKREQVIQGILDAIDHAKMTNEPAVEIRGWEAIAKLQGYNAPDRVVHDLPDDVKRMMESMKDMDDHQIAKLAGQDNLIELSPDGSGTFS